MYCERCGTKLEDNARFCPNCGSSVDAENIPKGNIDHSKEKDNSNKERESDIFEWEAPSVPDNQPSPGSKGGNKTTWIVSIAVTVAIVLATGGLIWYLLKPDSVPNDDVVVNPVKSAMKETSDGSGESEKTENQESDSVEITEKSEETKEETDGSPETENVEIKIEGAANTDKITQDPVQQTAASGEEKLPVAQSSENVQNTEQPSEENHPEPAPASVSENAAASAVLYEGTPDVSLLKEVSVISANATSTISQTKTNNNAMLLFDKKDDTSWQEGVSGYGINESVSFSFDSFHKVKYIAFKLGNWKNDKYYYGNAKPKTINLVFGDYSGEVTFTGERKVEWVEVSPSVNADSMRLELKDVYPGTSWEDTCISEVTVYAE